MPRFPLLLYVVVYFGSIVLPYDTKVVYPGSMVIPYHTKVVSPGSMVVPSGYDKGGTVVYLGYGDLLLTVAMVRCRTQRLALPVSSC